MGRIKAGWQLTKKAWGVVREHPGLMKLPVYGGLLAALAFVVFAVPGLALINPDAVDSRTVAGIALFAIGMYLGSFSIIYFNVALAATADLAFRGEPVDASAGMAVARSRRGVIARWALVSLIVSLIFNAIRERGGLFGEIAGRLGAAIWALVTFLIAPVLAFEDVGPLEALKRSTSMFRQKWGQQVTGNVAIGGIASLVMILFGLIAAAGIWVLATAEPGMVVAGGGLAVLGVVGFIAAAVVSAAVRGVFGVALYRYIADGTATGPFTAAELESTVRVK